MARVKYRPECGLRTTRAAPAEATEADIQDAARGLSELNNPEPNAAGMAMSEFPVKEKVSPVHAVSKEALTKKSWMKEYSLRDPRTERQPQKTWLHSPP